MLAERLNRALSVYQHQTDKCKILVSGGQGPDEPISGSISDAALFNTTWGSPI